MTTSVALAKFLLCPFLVALGDYMFRGVSYANAVQWIIVGIVIAVGGIIGDMTLLDRAGHVGGFLTDTLMTALVIWASQFFLAGAFATWSGALGVGLLVGLSELFVHRWVQMNRRAGVRENRP